MAEALKLLHVIGAKDPMAATAVLLAVRSSFGLPACFHLANIILQWMDDHDDRLLLTETMQRLGGLELRPLAEQWDRELFDRPPRATDRATNRADKRIHAVSASTSQAKRLELDSAELVGALNLLAAAKGGGKLRVSFDGQQLEIVRGITRVAVPAAGNWPLVALVRTVFVKELLRRRKALPEVVVLTGSDSHLHVSHYSIPCSWIRG